MAQEKIKLARVSHFNKDKEGNPLTSKKTGKPYTRCLIDTVDGRTMSGFGSDVTSNWNEGMEVTIETEEVESNGRTFWNFKTPKQGSVDLSEVHQKLDRIISLLEGKNAGESQNEPSDPGPTEDMSF